MVYKKCMNYFIKMFYDDSKLQKRTSFLVSGLILCFVIAIAALGVSIMVMMKGKEQAAQLTLSMPKARIAQAEMVKQLKEARMQIVSLQKQIDLLQHEATSQTQILNAFSASPMPELAAKNDVTIQQAPTTNHHHHEHSRPPKPDIYFKVDGSGEVDGDDDQEYDDDYYYSEEEGSGMSCPPFSTPRCPATHKICKSDALCPVPYCCAQDSHAHVH